MANILVDEEDKYLLDKYGFCVDSNGYAIACINYKNNYLHRIIMNANKGQVVDHINGNRLDNRKVNLRLVTKSQNNMNKKCSKNNPSGIVGVSITNRRSKYRADIKINGKGIYLGSYKNLEDAIKARKEAEIKYFGEYRRIV